MGDRLLPADSRRRWWVARQLDRLPWFCWADLVTWALGWSATKRLSDCGVSAICHGDAARNTHCYCGKVVAADASRCVGVIPDER